MDVLRAVAILLVVMAHSVLSYGAPLHLAPLQLGGIGVDLFFVLSGWLLGGLLFKEVKEHGNLKIKRFWYRRWMRTLPAYFVVLIFSVSQRYLTKDGVNFPWEYFIFIQNYNSLPFFSISWSLCVEEHFYIFIALVMMFLAKTNRDKVSIILLCLLLLPLLFRITGLYHSHEETHVRVDGCVVGVLLAHIYHNYPSFWSFLAKYSLYVALSAVFLFLLFFVSRYFPGMGIRDPDGLVLALIFGSWVLYANKSPKVRSTFYFPGAYYIATRSYSLYLLHPEMLALMKKYFLGWPFPLYFALALCGSLVLAEILYQFVEKPIMDVREKYKFSKAE
jgi:peptidoglycan/LPS O-acetylase OafA/YrhL